jgi:hypothetical protein
VVQHADENTMTDVNITLNEEILSFGNFKSEFKTQKVFNISEIVSSPLNPSVVYGDIELKNVLDKPYRFVW